MPVPYQYGVPTNELAGEAMEADPKSASFTWPGSVSRMFPALISLRKRRRSEARHSLFLMDQGREQLGRASKEKTRNAWEVAEPTPQRSDSASRLPCPTQTDPNQDGWSLRPGPRAGPLLPLSPPPRPADSAQAVRDGEGWVQAAAAYEGGGEGELSHSPPYLPAE